MITALIESPLLLLFMVIAIGYGLGEVRVRGFKLGVAAVLFVGLGFGALNPELTVPDFIVYMGLAIFVYTVGLASGPAFFASFRRHGLQDVYFALFAVVISGGMAWGVGQWLDLDAALTSGLYAGASTNTPALAGVLDAIQQAGIGNVEQLSQNAVVGYSLGYPMGIVGVILSVILMQRLLKADYVREAAELSMEYPLGEDLVNRTYRVSHPDMYNFSLREFRRKHHAKVAFGRIVHGEETTLANWESRPAKGDLIVIVGTQDAIHSVSPYIGEPAEGKINLDASVFDVHRIFVSNEAIAGKTIASLNLQEKYNVLITRVQRGDMDVLATGDTVLELGDRIMLIAHQEDVPEILKLFGNSYESLSRINLMSFGIGMTLGLLLGMIEVTLPGGYRFSLGFAGGPLIVALLLGQLRRTGPILWSLPFGANLTLRQVGLIFLLAGIGIQSGQTFGQTLQTDVGWKIFLASGFIAILSTCIVIVVGYRWLRIPFSFLGGMVGSQPAVLDFAVEQAGNKYPLIGYTRLLPVILIGKILVAQIIYSILS